MVQRIGFVIAMQSEGQSLISQLGLQAQGALAPGLPMLYFAGVYQGTHIAVALSGKDPQWGTDNIGTNAAVLATHLLIQRFQPDILINAGTAGGLLSSGVELGEVLVAEGSVGFHDRRIPLPKYAEYGEGNYPIHEAKKLRKALGLRGGKVSTGNSFDCSAEDLARLLEKGATLKDMEAGAVAWVCTFTRTPLVVFKAVTDFVDGSEDAAELFLRNYQLAVSNLTFAILKSIQFIGGKALSEI